MPHFDHMVRSTGSGETCPVWTEGHAHYAALSVEFEQRRPGSGIPHSCGPIPTAGGDARAIRAEGHALHLIGMAIQSENTTLILAPKVVPFPAARSRRYLF